MANLDDVAVSAREAEVLEALGERLTNAQIAQRLHISVRTVESHVSALLRKLDAADRRALADRALLPAPPPPPAARPFTGLPNRWTSFVGRKVELDELTEALAADRMVTLLGPGGIGKTTLATVAAERLAPAFEGGGAFVDLVPVGPDFVVEAVAAALGVVERPPDPLEAVVHERLLGQRVLLVLDNCEHVLGAVAAFAQGVLAACPEAVVLTTSRERLGVGGERVVAVPPLALSAGSEGSDADALFVDRARSVGGEDADPALVAEICRRLDGMPLAIELAAARSASLGVDGLLTGLDDRLRLLRSGPSGRHGSLRTALDWSHDLLAEDERVMFRRLAAFAGAFDLTAAGEVVGDGDDAATGDVLGRLADKSLVVHLRDATGSRWRMLETMRAYALEQLEASGEVDELRRRHRRWAATTAVDLEAGLDDDGAWQPAFDAVADDLRAALRHTEGGDRERHRLALALAHLSYARRFFLEARHHYESAVRSAPDEAAAVAALQISADAAYAEMRGDLSFDMLLTAYERANAAGDAAAAAICLADAATIGGRAPGTFQEPPAHERLVALVARARELAPSGDPEVEFHVEIAAAWNGRPGPTEPDPELAEHALTLARALGNPVYISDALDAVSAAECTAGRYRRSWLVTNERLELLDRMPRHDPRVGGEIADSYHMGTEAALAAGELDAALAAARLASADSYGQGLAHFAATHLIVPLALRGTFDETLEQAEVMEAGWERSGRPAAGWMAPAFYATALVYALRGEVEAFDRWWEHAQLMSVQHRFNSFRLFAEPRLALHQGDLERAVAVVAARDDATCGQYHAYAVAIGAEVAVMTGADDAEQQLAAASEMAVENAYAAAYVLRAAGRLHGDERELAAAVARWEVIGARFERACTLLLLPDRADEGRAELATLRCTLPSP